jgi:hypothetical protein
MRMTLALGAAGRNRTAFDPSMLTVSSARTIAVVESDRARIVAIRTMHFIVMSIEKKHLVIGHG